MVSVKYVAQDKISKEKTESSPAYFKEMNFLVQEIIEANRRILEKSLPTSRVFAVIQQEEIK